MDDTTANLESLPEAVLAPADDQAQMFELGSADEEIIHAEAHRVGVEAVARALEQQV